MQSALITGASSGIGRGIAHKFGEEGWEVTLVARRKSNLEKVAKEVEDAGGKAHIFATDLTEEGNPDAAVQFAIDKMGKIGTLVNNAGMGRFEMVPDIKDESYQEQFQLNVWACMAFVLTEFNGRKEGGTPEEQEWAMVPGDVAHAVYCVATQGPNSDIKEISIQVLDRS